MQHRWGDFNLDRKHALLTLAGRRVEVSRRVLDCIGHLVEHHDRVAGYDELIFATWGHHDVSNHQLSQIVLQARRAIGDDGQAQHSIRTIPGVGYRWVATFRSLEQHPEPPTTTPHASSRETLPEPEVCSSALPSTQMPVHNAPAHDRPTTKRPLRAAATFLLCLVVLAAEPYRMDHAASPAPPTRETLFFDEQHAQRSDPISSLRQSLLMGRFEAVREGLATLPPDIADGMEARLIEIELDFRRGRYALAAEKLALQTARAEAASDPVWQARLLLLQSELNNRLQASGANILAPAQSAVELLESAGAEVPPAILADALWRRANGFSLSDRFEEAQRDLIRARDLYQSVGDEHRGTEVRGSLARVRMRTGDLSDALEEMRAVANDLARQGDSIREIFARNTMTKIQIELLRWDDALASSDRSMALLHGVLESERRYPTLQLRAFALTGLGRLREAASLLEDAESVKSERRDFIIPAIHHLEAGDPSAALEAAVREFESSQIDTRSNLLLENKDGAALLWVAAAQALVAAGEPMPTPPEDMMRLLDDPNTATARCARGRWLLIQGRSANAEIELRQAMAEFGAHNQLYRMVLAAEPLIDALLQRGETDMARETLIALRVRAPERVDNDYRVSLLQLKLALAERDGAAIEMAYRNVAISGRERRPPNALLSTYRKFEVNSISRGSARSWSPAARGGDSATDTR
jgi:DNA-binding winged helix-turn-helix (wHTH) protein/predicted metal-dependent hydrolase